MPILQSCCCFKSLKKATIATGIYTSIYYTLNVIQASYEEHGLLNNSPLRLNQFTASAAFLILIFTISSSGIVTSFLLLFGVFKNAEYLLIPWILNMIAFTILDATYIFYGLLVHVLKWSPSVAVLLVLDFFLNAFNFYTVLCVVSYYQELKAQSSRNASNIQVVFRKTPASSNLHIPSQKREVVRGKQEKTVKFSERSLENEAKGDIKKHDAVPLINLQQKL
ncbi:lysosomal-associated transmembrane protein 5-like [Euwallacea fornicatus]|uniref:lysosomal-associated transmembrane protein 5-like n=1 Tax=Euwallacea fornicatus TaxID=995702 RepID=UPI00338DE293